jgi:hypothetical protein
LLAFPVAGQTRRNAEPPRTQSRKPWGFSAFLRVSALIFRLVYLFGQATGSFYRLDLKTRPYAPVLEAKARLPMAKALVLGLQARLPMTLARVLLPSADVLAALARVLSIQARVRKEQK